MIKDTIYIKKDHAWTFGQITPLKQYTQDVIGNMIRIWGAVQLLVI